MHKQPEHYYQAAELRVDVCLPVSCLCIGFGELENAGALPVLKPTGQILDFQLASSMDLLAD